MTRLPPEECAAFIGIDWADAKHDLCLQAAGTATRELRVLDHHPDTLDEWVSPLRTRFTEQPMAIGLELHKGPIVSALRPHGVLGLFPVHPLTLARSREACTPSTGRVFGAYAAAQPSNGKVLLSISRGLRSRLGSSAWEGGTAVWCGHMGYRFMVQPVLSPLPSALPPGPNF